MTATADPNDPSTWPEIGRWPKEPADVPDDTELGDGEPSPPPDECNVCGKTEQDAVHDNWKKGCHKFAAKRTDLEQRAYAYLHRDEGIPRNWLDALVEFAQSEEKWRSGAAQEVSPPATGTTSDPRTGYLMNLGGKSPR